METNCGWHSGWLVETNCGWHSGWLVETNCRLVPGFIDRHQYIVFFFGVHPLQMTTTSSQRWYTTWRGRIHVLRKFNVRRGCTVPSPLTWPSTEKSDGTKEFATTYSMDISDVLPETKFIGTCLHVYIKQVLSVGFCSPLGSCRREVWV